MKKFLILVLFLPLLSISQEKSDTSKSLKGTGTFYASYFDGLRTATGEIFKHSGLTAASNNFKMNTWVRVTNLFNNKSVVVRINDRMHPRMAKMGRVVDMTKAAAKVLGVGFSGLVKVKVEKIAAGDLW